jgi:hypothetical protein
MLKIAVTKQGELYEASVTEPITKRASRLLFENEEDALHWAQETRHTLEHWLHDMDSPQGL